MESQRRATAARPALLCAALLLLAPAGLRAEEQASPPSAEELASEHSKEGVSYYKKGLFKEAVREMMLAYELVPDATLLYNVARIYQKMGQSDLATGFFKRFVAHEGADPDTVKDALGHMESLESGGSSAESDTPEFQNLDPTQSEPPAPVVAAKEPAEVLPAAGVRNPAAIVTGVVAGSSFAVMAVTGALAISRNQVAKDQRVEWEERVAVRAEADRLGLVADVTLGVGIAASVATVVALIASRKHKAAVMIVPAGPSDGPGLTFSGHFGAGPRRR